MSFRKILHTKKESYLKHTKDPDKPYFQELRLLESLVYTGRLVQNFLPEQADRDKILKVIQLKVLKGMHLSITIKDIHAGYLISSYFKDIYLYLAQN